MHKVGKPRIRIKMPTSEAMKITRDVVLNGIESSEEDLKKVEVLYIGPAGNLLTKRNELDIVIKVGEHYFLNMDLFCHCDEPYKKGAVVYLAHHKDVVTFKEIFKEEFENKKGKS